MKESDKTSPDTQKFQSACVVYFSHSGNTRELATLVHESIGGDILELVPVEPYPTGYDAVLARAKQELDAGHKPALKTGTGLVDEREVVFVGFPNWWSTIPRPIATLLSEHDFSGKTVVPFCTHGGGGMGRSVTDIAKLCPRASVMEALAIRGSSVSSAANQVSEWLNSVCSKLNAGRVSNPET